MRLVRRMFIGFAIAAAAIAPSVVMAPHASADTCYVVQVGPQWFTVCP